MKKEKLPRNEIVFNGSLYYVYYIYRNNLVIYVGITNCPNQRLSGHIQRFGRDITLAIVDCGECWEMRAREKALIVYEFNNGSPLYNAICQKTINGRIVVKKGIKVKNINWKNTVSKRHKWAIDTDIR